MTHSISKVFALKLYASYLVIIPLGITFALMKHHMEPLDMTKTQGFRQDLYGYDLFLYP